MVTEIKEQSKNVISRSGFQLSSWGKVLQQGQALTSNISKQQFKSFEVKLCEGFIEILRKFIYICLTFGVGSVQDSHQSWYNSIGFTTIELNLNVLHSQHIFWGRLGKKLFSRLDLGPIYDAVSKWNYKISGVFHPFV